jgi:hypothetical protein
LWLGRADLSIYSIVKDLMRGERLIGRKTAGAEYCPLLGLGSFGKKRMRPTRCLRREIRIRAKQEPPIRVYRMSKSALAIFVLFSFRYGP